MAVINLIAQEQQLRRIAERKTRLLGLGWLLVGVLIGLGWSGLLIYIGAMSFQMARIEEQVVKLRPTVQQLKQAQAELGALQPLINTLQDARKDTGRWQQLFQHFTQHTPNGCFLTNVELGKRNDPKKPLEITLKGVAATQQLVGEFMLRLNQHPELEQVRLDYSQERALSEREVAVEFQISAQIKGTAQAEPENKEGQSGGQ
ncbi:MAG: PilN domain-containing protein [Fimbriimonadales bacterium]|nr:PilN domain-containing protein [Fimbriimonadales bacterium]